MQGLGFNPSVSGGSGFIGATQNFIQWAPMLTVEFQR
jgi:hypothetical protein